MYIVPAPAGTIFISFDNTNTTASPCTNAEFTIDLNTEMGKLLYTHALSAFHAGSKVKVYGTGECGLHNAETILDFQLYK